MRKFIFLILLSACIDPPQNKIPSSETSKSEGAGGSEASSSPSGQGDSPATAGVSVDSVEGPFLGKYSYEVLEGADTLTQKIPGEVSGSGSLRIVESFDRPSLDLNFWLSFGLPQTDSKVELIVFAEDSFDHGIEFSFTRVSTKNPLQVIINASGESEDISPFFASYRDLSKIEFSIDVHNAHAGPAHFIFWASLDSKKILIDSSGKFNSPGRGFGRRWGFRVHNSHVFSTRISKARNSH